MVEAVTLFTKINNTLTGVVSGAVDWADYDGDGDKDLLITGSSNSGRIAKIYNNNGSGSFTENTNVSLPGVSDGSVDSADYDGDGDLDLLITGSSNSGQIAKIYNNNGSGNFTENTNVSLPGVYDSSLDWADYDGDGDFDLLLTGYYHNPYNPIAKIYNNNGSGSFTENTVSLPSVFAESVDWADYDGDGDLDLLITGSDLSNNRIAKIYNNNGSGSFTKNTNVSLPGVSAGSVDSADYDGGGDLDLLLTGYANSGPIAKIYNNNGSGSFTEDNRVYLAGVSAGSVDSADYDGDGDLDLLITGHDGYRLIAEIYRNNSPASNQIIGTTGRNNLIDTNNSDNIDALDGNDTINGGLGSDTLHGGTGIDRVLYKSSPAAVNVNLISGMGTGGHAKGDRYDSIENVDGSRFDDLLIGDVNNNTFYAGKGNDTLQGNDGNDYLSGENGNDSIIGSDGLDKLYGRNDNDTLTGDAGNDILYGGSGSDRLIGTNATSKGVGESDRLTGDLGNDTFVLGTSTVSFYDDGNNANKGITDYALIFDFNFGDDLIELSGGQNYYLNASPINTPAGTGIFIDNDGFSGFSSKDELIAILENITTANGLEITSTTTGFSLLS
jgi:hypothetical protein